MTDLANEIAQAENRADLRADSARCELQREEWQAAIAWALLAIDSRLEVAAKCIEHASDEINGAISYHFGS